MCVNCPISINFIDTSSRRSLWTQLGQLQYQYQSLFMSWKITLYMIYLFFQYVQSNWILEQTDDKKKIRQATYLGQLREWKGGSRQLLQPRERGQLERKFSFPNSFIFPFHTIKKHYKRKERINWKWIIFPYQKVWDCGRGERKQARYLGWTNSNNITRPLG
jgi:hypothetical protein